MGWGNCGEDSQGRPIGYCHSATCDHPGCNAKIDRGLSYACGGMHGVGTARGGDTACEKYFCSKHLFVVEHKDGECLSVCRSCEKQYADQWKDEDADD